MGLYVPVWSYMQVDARYAAVVAEECEKGWEPFATTMDRVKDYMTSEMVDVPIIHLRRPTGRRVRVSDD